MKISAATGGIENSQHWMLDVAFGEHRSRKRASNAAENFGILNRLAFNLLKKDTTVKANIKRKRKMAGWDEGYLERLHNTLKIYMRLPWLFALHDNLLSCNHTYLYL